MPRNTMTIRRTTPAPTAPVVERPGPEYNPITRKLDWSRYNATIVGNVPVIGAPANPGFLPGLEATQGPNARPPPYRMVSFAATREYADNEGWQHVGRKKKRSWRGKRQAEESLARADAYDALAEADA